MGIPQHGGGTRYFRNGSPVPGARTTPWWLAPLTSSRSRRAQSWAASSPNSSQPQVDSAHVWNSDRQQPLEEVAVALERDAQVLRGSALSSSPLLLEPRARVGESCRQLFDDLRHKSVGLLNTLFGVVDERGLDIVP